MTALGVVGALAISGCSSSDFDMRGNAQSLAEKELSCDSVILDSSGQVRNPDGSYEERFNASGCGKSAQYRCKKSYTKNSGYTGFCCNFNDPGCLYR